MMELMTKEILKAFEKQGDTSEMHPKDIRIIAKLFNPIGAGTWYLYEYDPKTRIAWCFANLGDPTFAECGTVSLDEIEGLQLPLGMHIERDRHFGDHTLEDVINKVKNGEHV